MSIEITFFRKENLGAGARSKPNRKKYTSQENEHLHEQSVRLSDPGVRLGQGCKYTYLPWSYTLSHLRKKWHPNYTAVRTIPHFPLNNRRTEHYSPSAVADHMSLCPHRTKNTGKLARTTHKRSTPDEFQPWPPAPIGSGNDVSKHVHSRIPRYSG